MLTIGDRRFPETWQVYFGSKENLCCKRFKAFNPSSPRISSTSLIAWCQEGSISSTNFLPVVVMEIFFSWSWMAQPFLRIKSMFRLIEDFSRTVISPNSFCLIDVWFESTNSMLNWLVVSPYCLICLRKIPAICRCRRVILPEIQSCVNPFTPVFV